MGFKILYASCWLQPEYPQSEYTSRPGYHGSSPERLTGKVGKWIPNQQVRNNATKI